MLPVVEGRLEFEEEGEGRPAAVDLATIRPHFCLSEASSASFWARASLSSRDFDSFCAMKERRSECLGERA